MTIDIVYPCSLVGYNSHFPFRIAKMSFMKRKIARELLKKAGIVQNGHWAVYGLAHSECLFALADILGHGGNIEAVGRQKRRSKNSAEREVPASIRVHEESFPNAKKFDDLDGILLSHSLHQVENQLKFLAELMLSIKNGGKLIIIDFNSRRGNPWLKYPVPIGRLNWLSRKLNLPKPKILATHKKRFGRVSYLAEIDIADLRS